MWPSDGKRCTLDHRKWTRRRWWRFCPIRHPHVILGTRFFRYTFDLIGTKSSVPYDRPLLGQTLQKDQSLCIDRAGLPSVIPDLDFSTVRPGDDLCFQRKSKDAIYPAVILPQLLQSFSVALPNPTIKEHHPNDANNQGDGSSSNPAPMSDSFPHEFFHNRGHRYDEDHGQ